MASVSLSEIDLLDHDRFRESEPWEWFELLQREAPVFHHPEPDGGPGFWNITRYADVVAVLADFRTFSSELGGCATIADLDQDILEARRNFLEFDPPRHSFYRKLLAADFTPRAVGKYRPWLQELTAEVLPPVLARGECEWVHEVAAPIPIRVLGRILGLRDEHLPRLIELGDKMLVDTEPEYTGELAFSGRREEDRYKPFGSPYGEELALLGREYYAERRGCPVTDVLSILANAERDGKPLDQHDLDNEYALLVVAGNETTRQAIAMSALALARNPEQWDLLRGRPALLEGAVDELMRFVSPVWHFRRTARRDCEIAGTRIAAGEKVVVWFAAANRDPAVYENASVLDITRDASKNATFGRGGPHFCLGAHLAKLELEVVLEYLMPRVARFELNGEPQRLRSNFTNGLKRLPLRLVPA